MPPTLRCCSASALGTCLLSVMELAQGSQHHNPMVVPIADVIALLCGSWAPLAVHVLVRTAEPVDLKPLLTQLAPV